MAGVEDAVNEFSNGSAASGLSSTATKAITKILNSTARPSRDSKQPD